jgi:PIN domain nuclease of toxin-antitoxin system
MSRLLLDTHVVLWTAMRDRRLPKDLPDKIRQAEERYLSAASVVEMAIKSRIGKLEGGYVALDVFRRAGLQPLAITWDHAERLASLPLLHSDPFDRLLVTQAQAEGLTIVTDDKFIRRYDVPILF